LVTLISAGAAELVTGYIGAIFVSIAAGDDIDYISCATICFIALVWRSSYLFKSNATQQELDYRFMVIDYYYATLPIEVPN
jgi:hypothetical protein